MSDTRTFAYRPKRWLLLLCALFFAPCAFFIGARAIDLQEIVVWDSKIDWVTAFWVTFYWALSLFAVLFATFAVCALIRSFSVKKEVEITDLGISAPRSPIWGEPKFVTFAEIEGIQEMSVSGQHFIEIHYPDGKLSIARQGLANKAEWDELRDLIVQRLEALG